MKKFLLSALVVTAVSTAFAEDTTIRLFEKAIFYDGYRSEVVDAELNDGILRHKNSLYAVKLTDEQLSSIGKNLTLNIDLGARCDNYDRIGDIHLAFVPKGSETYNINDVDRIEIARFITPFMNHNRNPKSVPYNYNLAGVSEILRDSKILGKYDIWLEAEVFGVPYAANEQVYGCKDRNDVFDITLDFVTDEPAPAVTDNVLVPIYIKKPEDHGDVNFNNYKECATDTLGVTTRTFEFEVPCDVNDSKVVFILTNHGANSGGEEYVRRYHIVYFDGEEIFAYTPGGVSCEPYRKYNTQSNGIYGSYRSEASWKSSSNWCPGQAVPIRELHLGALKKGTHKVMIRVPSARFVNKQGDFRPSLYFQGSENGTVPLGVNRIEASRPDVTFSRNGQTLVYESETPAKEICLYSMDGQLLYGSHHPGGGQLDLSGWNPGSYIVILTLADGSYATHKLVK